MTLGFIYWGGGGGNFNPWAWVAAGVGYFFYEGWNCEPMNWNGMYECGLF